MGTAAPISKKAREMVRRIIMRHFGSKPHHIAREAGGLSNLVFSVDHDAGEFVVRLNPSRAMLKVFLKEQWAIARAREAGVPTPEVLDVGSDPLPYMILRKSQGEPATFHPDRIRILHDLGGYAARINSIRTHGFGDSFDWWRNELSSSAQGWESFYAPSSSSTNGSERWVAAGCFRTGNSKGSAPSSGPPAAKIVGPP
jgi:hygromycin-B 4-O-kinase